MPFHLVLQYYWILSILLLAQVIIIIFVFIFYFMDDVAKKLNFYPENVLRDAIIRYRDDVDMRNFIDDLQQFVRRDFIFHLNNFVINFIVYLSCFCIFTRKQKKCLTVYAFRHFIKVWER